MRPYARAGAHRGLPASCFALPWRAALVPLFDPALLWRSLLAKPLPWMLAQLLIERPATALGGKHHVIFTLPLGVTYSLVLIHRDSPNRVLWRLTTRSLPDGPPEMSTDYCLPGRAGGTPGFVRGNQTGRCDSYGDKHRTDPSASLDSRPVASGYLGRLRTCKITRPCQAETSGDPKRAL